MVEARRSAGLCGALCLGAVLAACGGAPEVATLPPPEVTVSRPVERRVSEDFETTGRTESVESVEIRARVSGYIDRVDFTYGALVKAGQVLYEIDPRPYEAAVLSAEGVLAKWHAALAKAQADAKRAQNLLPRGAASQSDLDTAIANRDTALAEIKSAEAALEQAKLNLDFTMVKSPIDGRVSRSNLTVGNLVQVSAAGSDPLTTVMSVKPIWVYFDIDERTLLQARDRRGGDREALDAASITQLRIPVQIGLANDEGYPEEGVLDFVDNTVDPSTGTIKVRAVFSNDDGRLLPGLFVRVRLQLGEPLPTVLVPEQAIGTDQSSKYVLVVNDQNVAEYRRVTLGQTREGGMRIVRSGLQGDEWIITAGLQRVRPGMTVEPKRVGETTSSPSDGAPAPSAAPPPASGS